MKKIFTLVIAACAALSANAKQTLDLFSPWGGTCTLEGSTYTFNGSWAGAGLWMGTEVDGVNTWCDASAYDYAYIAYSNHTGGNVAFGVCYNHWEKTESWGEVYTTVSLMANASEGIVAIKLDKASASDGGKTYAQEVRQLQIQDQGSACAITIDELAFITEEEYQAILNGQGTEPGQADSNVLYDGGETLSWNAVNISGDKLKGLTAPVKLAITVQSTTGGWWQFKFCDQSWQSLNLNGAEFINANSVEGYAWNTEDFTTIVELDADQLAKAANGFIAQGSGGDDGGSIILKKVALANEASISAIEAAPAATAAFNIAGQRTNATSGLMIRGGKLILVK